MKANRATKLESTTGRTRPARGFTLTELLIVIAIILILTITSLPAVLQTLRDRKFSDAARTIQAAFAGARDRAIASGEVRGLRLIREANDPFQVSTLVYVGVPAPYSVGTVNASSGRVIADIPVVGFDPHWETADAGQDGKPGRALIDDDGDGTTDNATELGWLGSDDIPRVARFNQAFIRFGSAGRLYPIANVVPSLTPGKPYELLVASPAVPAGATYQIFNPPSPLAGVDPISLPEGMVIDARCSPIRAYEFPHPMAGNTLIDVPRSRWIPNQVPPAVLAAGSSDLWPKMDILFSPDGQVTGGGAGYPLIHFWVGERGDKGPDPTASCGGDGVIGTADDMGPAHPHFLMTLTTRTGAVRVFQGPGTASLNVWPPPPVATQLYYSEIYAPAVQLLGKSKLDLP